MFRNYLKIAWRNIRNDKIYSTINFLGLAIGMAVTLLVELWVFYEYSSDRSLPAYSQLYQVKVNFNYNGNIVTQSGSALPLADILRKDIPGIKYVAESNRTSSHTLTVGERKVYLQGLQIGADFLRMFEFPLLNGNTASVLQDPNSIVLTESSAKSLFGSDDPFGKLVLIDSNRSVKVTGVLKDIPGNSSFRFDFLLPFSYFEQTENPAKKARTQWKNYSFPEYVELDRNTTYESIEPKIKNLLQQHETTKKVEVFLHPLRDWRLFSEFKNGKASGGFIEYVRLFGIIGIMILIIACINFINLSTARSEKRAKEVGVRKVMGSLRRELIIQFLIESTVSAFISFVISIGLVQLALPSFNNFTHTHINIPYFSPTFWCVMMGYVLLTGLLSGMRPAFYFSSFRASVVLKGKILAGQHAALGRKLLVGIQFSCSIALIISTLIVYQQIEFAKGRPVGYDANQLVTTSMSPDLRNNYFALKSELLKTGAVSAVTKASSPLTYYNATMGITTWPGKNAGESYEFGVVSVSGDYFSSVGMGMDKGRQFSGNDNSDSMCVILNEAAAKTLRLKEPLNQMITWDYKPDPMRIIGVVKNAVIGSPFTAIEPIIFVSNPKWDGSILYRLSPGLKTRDAIEKVAKVFTKYNPKYPFSYQFEDEAYAQKFGLEEFIGTLSGLFSLLAIFISCIGLFGMISYIATRRSKEMSIRKVLGASTLNLWFLLSREFIILILISCLIASALSWYFLHSWLEKYEYRISIGYVVFIKASLIAVLIALTTVSYKSIRVALTNPIKNLKNE